MKDNDLLQKYNIIWDKVSFDIKKNLIASLSKVNNFVKTKIKSHGDKVEDFYDKEIPKVGSNHICLAEVSLDSALKKNENYNPYVFVKECKCIENKVVRCIYDNLSYSSSDETDEE